MQKIRPDCQSSHFIGQHLFYLNIFCFSVKYSMTGRNSNNIWGNQLVFLCYSSIKKNRPLWIFLYFFIHIYFFTHVYDFFGLLPKFSLRIIIISKLSFYFSHAKNIPICIHFNVFFLSLKFYGQYL